MSLFADYVRHGWALIDIPRGQKGPRAHGWNTRERAITDPEIAECLDGNVGLAHGFSKSCAVDIDDIDTVAAFLAERGIDLYELLAAPDAVRIDSGREGRAKLLYAMPKPRPSFKLKKLELRCAASTGATLQDVLPPSIHPDTGKPYAWRYNSPMSSWRNLPPLPEALDKLWLGLITPRTTAPVSRAPVALPRLKRLLAKHDPDSDYDTWCRVGMAIHHDTRGSADGFALWDAWSSTGKKYKGAGDLEPHWRSFKADRDNPATVARLRVDEPASADEFPFVDDDDDDSIAGAVDMPSATVSGASADASSPPPDAARSGRVAAPAPTVPPIEPSDAARALASLRRAPDGSVLARISNVCELISHSHITGTQLVYDTFGDVVMCAPAGTEAWRPFKDTDYTMLRIWLETAGSFQPVSHEMVRHSVMATSEKYKIDTAQIWLAALADQWDGVQRIDTFVPRYWGTIDGSYERAVGVYLWTALAGRIMDPGCQVDMVPVLIGAQGIGKSQGVRALVPDQSQYASFKLDDDEDNLARKMRGVLVAELEELRGLWSVDNERIKTFITRTHEKWRQLYSEFAHLMPRRFVMIGTTNEITPLAQNDENRRWLPIRTAGVDVEAIRRDRDMLWAEAVQRWAIEGVAWSPLSALAPTARNDATPMDQWEPLIGAYLADTAGQPVRLHDVLAEGIGLDIRLVRRDQERRVCALMREAGYEPALIWHKGKPERLWRMVKV